MYGVYLSVKLYTISENPLLVYDKLSAQDMLWVNRSPGGLSLETWLALGSYG